MNELKPVNQSGERYEKRDINTRKVALLGGAMLVLVCAAGLITAVMLFKGTADKGEDAALSPLYEAQQLPPQPRLQANPPQDLKKLRAAEEVQLTSYGWVDRTNGVVRIPIERAIDLVARRGLPPKPESQVSTGRQK